MVTPGPPGNTVLMLFRIQGQIFHLNSLGRSLYVSNVTDTASIIGNIQLIQLSSLKLSLSDINP